MPAETEQEALEYAAELWERRALGMKWQQHNLARKYRELEAKLAQSVPGEDVRAVVEALQWYSLEAEAVSKHLLKGKDSNLTAVTASMQVLGIDAGNRARAALVRPAIKKLIEET